MKPASILLVEDEDELRDVVAELLSTHGHRVTTARDGVEASRTVASGEFDLLITDLIMPERDGVLVINEARRKYPKLRIIAMSGGGHIPREQYLKIAKGMGAHAVLEKPFSHEKLLAAMEQVMASAPPAA